MEEEDKKAERDLEILKKYHKKETKSVKKIFIENGTLIKKGEILNQKELNLEKNQKEKDKDKKRRIRVTCVLLSMARN